MKTIYTIIINATAAKTSGALTVLKECVSYIEANVSQDKKYHLFTVLNEFDTLKNITVHKLKPQTWVTRIKWDNGGLQKWCRKHNLEPEAIISLQNTSTKYRNKAGIMIIQVVYYHNTIPLYQRNGLRGAGYKLLLYRYFYPFFVNKNNSSSHYVVQLPYIKELFCKKFKNISSERITVIYPNKPIIDIQNIARKTLNTNNKMFAFIYPATLFGYKNHIILIKALAEIKKKNQDLLEKIILYFTIDEFSKKIKKIISNNNLEKNIKLIGQVSYQELLSYYNSVDALLFPSKVESFGLPLLEASCFGLPIIASDLPYAREVLEDYKNKYFVNPEDVTAWAEAIGNYKEYRKIMLENTNFQENSWKDFFQLVEKLVLE